MAKKKAKAGRLPKEVLGVKLPKELRKAGERLIEQAQGPAGRQAIAGALTAVAGAAMTAALSRTAAKAARPEAPVRPEKPERPEPPKRPDAPEAAQGAAGERRADPAESLARAAEQWIGKFFDQHR